MATARSAAPLPERDLAASCISSSAHDLSQNTSELPDSLDAGFSVPVLLGAFAAALSSLNFGWCLGEPNIPEDIIKDCVEGTLANVNGLPTCIPMSTTVWGLVVGMVALGALTGSLVAGKAADRFGRKTVLLANNAFFISGAVLLATSTTIAQLAVGRFVSGIGCGVASTVVATYNNECAPSKVRGFVGAVLQLTVEVGIFLAQLVAIFLADVPNWRILFGLSGAISIIQLICLPFMPESPKFLAKQGRFNDATLALRFLRPGHDVSRELQTMVSSVNNNTMLGIYENNSGFAADINNEDKVAIENGKPSICIEQLAMPLNQPAVTVGLFDILKGRTPDTIWHPLFCTLFLMGFQQWSGTKGIVFYSTEIMENIFHLSRDQIKHTPNSAQWVTIGIAATGVVAVLSSMFLIDRLGRRRLLLVSTGGLVVSCTLIVLGCALNINVLAVLSIFSFKVFYGLGLAPIPWLSASEMLPYYVLGTLSGIASALNWTMIFIIGLLFPVLSNVLGNYLFLPFAALNMMAFVVVLLFIPETKGRTISDILYQHGKRIHVIYSVSKRKASLANHTQES